MRIPLNALFSSSMKLSCVALLQSPGSGPLITLLLRSSSFSEGSAAMPATCHALVLSCLAHGRNSQKLK